MDIVFLQKRDMPRSLDEPLPEWTEVDTVEEHTYTGRRRAGEAGLS